MPKAQVPEEMNDNGGNTSVEGAAANAVKDSSSSKPDDDHNDVGTESESKSGSGSGSNDQSSGNDSKEVSANTATPESTPVNTDKGDIVFPNTARIESVADSNVASAASDEASNWAGENIEKLAAGASAVPSSTVGVAAVDTASVSTLSSVNAPKVHLDPLIHSRDR